MDRLRVGGWLPPARIGAGQGTAPARRRRAGPAHAAPESPAAYEAPAVDLDAPVSAPVPPPRPRRRAASAGVDVVAGVGRYVHAGRLRFGELVAPGQARQRAWLGLAAVGLLALAVAAVAMLSPDGGRPPAGGQGLALPTAPPQEPPPSGDQEIGAAAPSPTPSRAKKAPAAPGPFTRSYEAEDAALIGGAEVLSLRAASGGRIVRNIGSGPDRRAGLVSFTEVDVPATNRYALTVDYVSGEDRFAILSINTETHFKLSFPSSGGWDVVASRTFTISLVGGRNNLTFSNPDGWAPRLDRINLLG
ncbi:hypothetical protein GCM10023170_016470 [Phytohabitans houttuyneae]|uniref:CBM6 domain-containing protein n=2 Tax=Phytohabitans houttuyneae TaxID=1076126 RepID=A0A6V8KZH5_9ACTN|nr:hypothetical protein Phou_101050 [Phytohabitans houttuyneae]